MSLALMALGTLCFSGCMHSHASFLQLDVTFPDGAPAGLTILDVPLAKLRTSKIQLDPQRIAVYRKGREPLPHKLLDKDGDGRPDHLRVKVRPDADQAWLVFVSPGEPNPGALPAGGDEARATFQ